MFMRWTVKKLKYATDDDREGEKKKVEYKHFTCAVNGKYEGKISAFF